MDILINFVTVCEIISHFFIKLVTVFGIGSPIIIFVYFCFVFVSIIRNFVVIIIVIVFLIEAIFETVSLSPKHMKLFRFRNHLGVSLKFHKRKNIFTKSSCVSSTIHNNHNVLHLVLLQLPCLILFHHQLSFQLQFLILSQHFLLH